jgi:hypothetical protein
MKTTFRVSRSYPKILRNRKRRIEKRLAPRTWEDQPQPMMQGSNVHYELSDKTRATSYGGLGAVHVMVQRLGLVEAINQDLQLLKVHLPYHESDHVLNMAYNVLSGGQRLEDIELRRQDESFLNGLGAQRIPDPTTAGDFTRRFKVQDLTTLQECINRTRQRVWQEQPKGFLAEAFLDVDGTIAGTYGECKGGMGLSYKGIWGYAPLVVSLANTREVLYVVNRPGNVASHQDSVPWIDRAIELVKPIAGRITLRGDTDFSHTAQLDRGDQAGVGFVLGLDAHTKVVQLAEGLSERSWRPLERLPVDDLVSNGAYMVMAALAWNLKAWYGLLVPDRARGLELVRMEFRRFLHAIILLPVQILRAGRKIIYRLLGYNGWLKDFFATWQRLQKLEWG